MLRSLNLFLVVLAISSCATKEPIKPTFYLTDAEKGEIYREKERISCTDVKFKKFVCLSDFQLKQLHDQCVEKQTAWWQFWR